MNEIKKYNVIKAVHHGKKTKQRACVELTLSLRQINRLLNNYVQFGKSAFSHKNKKRSPKHSLPESTKTFIVELYQSFTNLKPNVVHFTEILKQEHGINLTDTTVRTILYNHGMISPKTHRKTVKRLKQQKKVAQQVRHELSINLPRSCEFLADSDTIHPSRPRKKYCGELIQMDASQFRWFGQTVSHLHVAIDDASGNIVGAYFAPQETLKGYYQVLHQILTNYGIPAAFLTDRRTVFDYQRKGTQQLQDDTMTQFGFACFQLGISLKTTSIPQGKGRVERLNNTLQSRLPVDL
ncbi:ISNCY family transposase, partial [Granulicatella sp. WM01]|uniref:ISNCY family transposase n=1 Tax=unclassified Granulicatella TaxID=2630493 RepID=UPI001FD7C019